MKMSHIELIALYRFLLARDLELDDELATLFTKVQKEVFSKLTVNEVENLDEYYKKLLNKD